MEKNDFELQWQRRQQAMQETKDDVPTDEVVLGMAKIAQKTRENQSVALVPPRRKYRWIPYAAAASILIGVAVVGWQRVSGSSRHIELEEVSVEGQTIRFLCNSGCSVDDVLHSAQNIITE